MFLRSMLIAGLSIGVPTLAAAEDSIHVTEAEKAACKPDVEQFCASSTDEQQLLLCMKTNRASLSPTCLPVFDAGLKRRGL